MREIDWYRTGGKTHVVTIRESGDRYPADWNRSYLMGELVNAWPGNKFFYGNKFYDCSFF